MVNRADQINWMMMTKRDFSSEYPIGPRRVAWCHFALQPKALVEILSTAPHEAFADVREWVDNDGYIDYPALVDKLEVIPVITAIRRGDGWQWYAKVNGLLSDGPHVSVTKPFTTKTDALMAGLEKYPNGVVDDRPIKAAK